MILIIVLFLLLFIVVMPFVYASDMFNGIKTLQKPAEERQPGESWDAWSSIIVVVGSILFVIWLAS